LDKSPSKPVDNVTLKAPNATDIAGQRMDSYRFSMANLEGKTVIAEILQLSLDSHCYRDFNRILFSLAVLDTQDVDLDAVLGELCALESQYQSTSSLLDSEKIGLYTYNYIDIFVITVLLFHISIITLVCRCRFQFNKQDVEFKSIGNR
jgi:hypothetical protein